MWTAKGFTALSVHSALVAASFIGGFLFAMLGDIGSDPVYHGGWMLVWNAFYLGLIAAIAWAFPVKGVWGVPRLPTFLAFTVALGFFVVCGLEWASNGQHCQGSVFDSAMSVVTLFWLPAALGLRWVWFGIRPEPTSRPDQAP